MKYIITDRDTVAVDVYIENSNGVKAYGKKTLLEILGKELELLRVKNNEYSLIKELNEGQKKEQDKIKGEIEGKEKAIANINKNETPEGFAVERLMFVKPDGAADEYITNEGWDRNEVTGKVTFNRSKYYKSFMATLLKSWTLAKNEPELKLDFVPMPEFQTKLILAPKTLDMIWKLHPNILKTILFEADNTVYGEELSKK